MSTKIYDGFVFSGSVFALMKTLDRFRPYVRRESASLMDQFNEKVVPQLEPGKQWIAWMDLRADVETKNHRNVLVDTTFEVTLFPVRECFWIGIMFSVQEKWKAKFLRMDGISDYSYWDNTDAPKGMAESGEWTLRMIDWDRMLLNKKPPIPCCQGLSIRLDDPLGPLPKAIRKKR